MIQKVYVSSTSRDTDSLRAIAEEVVLQMGMFPILFERLTAGSQSVLETLKQQVDETDIFVGIYAYRYGFIPEGYDISLTHLEYRWAKERKIPCLLFILQTSDNTPEEYFEQEKQTKLQEFRQEMLSDFVVSFFVSAEDFRAKLVIALANIKREAPSPSGSAESLQAAGDETAASLDKNAIQQIINQTLDLYEARRQVESDKAQPRQEDPATICVETVFGQPRKEQQYFCDVFAIMPFDAELKPVFDFVMKPVCKDLALDIKRGDDFYAPNYIMDEIWTAIYRSKLVIVDCSMNKANVFYELGIAHTLGKPAILLTRTSNDLPFDIRARRILTYTDTGAGFEKIKTDLKDAIIKIMNTQPS